MLINFQATSTMSNDSNESVNSLSLKTLTNSSNSLHNNFKVTKIIFKISLNKKPNIYNDFLSGIHKLEKHNTILINFRKQKINHCFFSNTYTVNKYFYGVFTSRSLFP